MPEMFDPPDWISQHPYWVLGPLVAILLTTGKAQFVIARRHLVTDDNRRPIPAMQKAGTHVAMKDLISSWGPAGPCHARRTLFWDFWFLLTYGAILAFLCALGAANLRKMDASFAAWFWIAGVWISMGAAALDALENLLLWRMFTAEFEGDLIPKSMRLASKWKWKAVGTAASLALMALLFDLFGCRFDC
ncbi:MAG: hypothetical protein ACRDH9_12525 [Actinomycetota bacterium]